MITINGKPAETEEQVRQLPDKDLVMLAYAGGGSARVPGMWAQAEMAARAHRSARMSFLVTTVGTLAAIVAAVASLMQPRHP